MQPIETIYNGYRFRSRLEARWAVFFDAINMEYRYEHEGFDLDGTYYLPDFYLPRIDCYVEIKPFFNDSIYDEDEAKARCRLFRDKTRQSIVLCYGEPKKVWSLFYGLDMCESSGGSYEGPCTFAYDSRYGAHILIRDDRSDRDFANRRWRTFKRIVNIAKAKCLGINQPEAEFDITPGAPESYGKLTYDASIMARQARFEHGEAPFQNQR